jgi:hypothetical protein
MERRSWGWLTGGKHTGEFGKSEEFSERFALRGGLTGKTDWQNGVASLWIPIHITKVAWQVVFAPEFGPEFDALDTAVQDELVAQARLLERLGPRLGRPRVDTLSGAKHANLKELRFDAAGGVWRVAFAFDPQRKAIRSSPGISPAARSGASTRT